MSKDLIQENKQQVECPMKPKYDKMKLRSKLLFVGDSLFTKIFFALLNALTRLLLDE